MGELKYSSNNKSRHYSLGKNSVRHVRGITQQERFLCNQLTLKKKGACWPPLNFLHLLPNYFSAPHTTHGSRLLFHDYALFLQMKLEPQIPEAFHLHLFPILQGLEIGS